MTKEDRIKRIDMEAVALIKNLNKINTFIKTKGFNELDIISKDLLLIQRNAMETYRSCLMARVTKLQQEINNDNL